MRTCVEKKGLSYATKTGESGGSLPATSRALRAVVNPEAAADDKDVANYLKWAKVVLRTAALLSPTSGRPIARSRCGPTGPRTSARGGSTSATNLPASLLPVGVIPTTSRESRRTVCVGKWPEAKPSVTRPLTESPRSRVVFRELPHRLPCGRCVDPGAMGIGRN